VLANSARPLISLHEEMEFLETYLQIEEARFGSRLQVKIAVDPAVAMEQIPSLILQPIVENALKHGWDRSPVQATCGSLPRRTGIRCVCEWKMTASDPQSVS